MVQNEPRKAAFDWEQSFAERIAKGGSYVRSSRILRLSLNLYQIKRLFLLLNSLPSRTISLAFDARRGDDLTERPEAFPSTTSSLVQATAPACSISLALSLALQPRKLHLVQLPYSASS
jgi:hypothetical protein